MSENKLVEINELLKYREKHFKVEMHKPHGGGYPDEYCVSVTHNGRQYASIALLPNEAKAVVNAIENHFKLLKLQPDEELVEDFANRISDCFELKSDKSCGGYLYYLETDEIKLRSEIRSLLQSRQPEKVRATEEEMRVLDELIKYHDLPPFVDTLHSIRKKLGGKQ